MTSLRSRAATLRASRGQSKPCAASAMRRASSTVMPG